MNPHHFESNFKVLDSEFDDGVHMKVGNAVLFFKDVFDKIKVYSIMFSLIFIMTLYIYILTFKYIFIYNYSIFLNVYSQAMTKPRDTQLTADF